jgi:peptidoglycan hydrolase-like protein with peptidoglycan-binding domain
VPKKFKEEVGGIKSRVDTLEARVEGVESKQIEVDRVASQQMQTLEELRAQRESAVKTNVTVKNKRCKTRTDIKELQTCLANAGFYKGNIDGVKGKNTRRAIKEFQSANGLKADGVVGPKTWEALSKYATAAAPGAGLTDEGQTK